MEAWSTATEHAQEMMALGDRLWKEKRANSPPLTPTMLPTQDSYPEESQDKSSPTFVATWGHSSLSTRRRKLRTLLYSKGSCNLTKSRPRETELISWRAANVFLIQLASYSGDGKIQHRVFVLLFFKVRLHVLLLRRSC